MTSTVAVIGLGAMGAALAHAQLGAGHRTIVWNRSAEKADKLVTKGAVYAPTAHEAVRSADVALVCVDTNASAEAVLQDIWDKADLAGRVIVQLTTTSPNEARSFAAKVRAAGGRALDGAIMCYPDSVGPENTAPVMIGGDKSGFRDAASQLSQISANLIDLEDNVAAAAALDLGLLTTSIALYAGVAHAARLCEAEGADVALLGKLCMHGPRALERFEIIAKDAFALNSLYDGGSLGVWAHVAKSVKAQADASGINSDLPDFLNAFYGRAVDAGHADEDVAALVKSLRGA